VIRNLKDLPSGGLLSFLALKLVNFLFDLLSTRTLYLQNTD